MQMEHNRCYTYTTVPEFLVIQGDWKDIFSRKDIFSKVREHNKAPNYFSVEMLTNPFLYSFRSKNKKVGPLYALIVKMY